MQSIAWRRTGMSMQLRCIPKKVHKRPNEGFSRCSILLGIVECAIYSAAKGTISRSTHAISQHAAEASCPCRMVQYLARYSEEGTYTFNQFLQLSIPNYEYMGQTSRVPPHSVGVALLFSPVCGRTTVLARNISRATA